MHQLCNKKVKEKHLLIIIDCRNTLIYTPTNSLALPICYTSLCALTLPTAKTGHFKVLILLSGRGFHIRCSIYFLKNAQSVNGRLTDFPRDHLSYEARNFEVLYLFRMALPLVPVLGQVSPAPPPHHIPLTSVLRSFFSLQAVLRYRLCPSGLRT